MTSSKPKLLVYIPDADVPDKRGFSVALIGWLQTKNLDPNKYQIKLLCGQEGNVVKHERIGEIEIERWEQSPLYKRLFKKITRWDPYSIERKCASVANRFGADLIHVHQIEFRLNILRKYLKRPIPIVLHMHNVDRSYKPEIGSADAYVAASNTICQHMAGQGFPLNLAHVVTNAVDIAVFNPNAIRLELMAELKERYGISDNKHMLLFFGIRDKRKGYPNYLEMMDRLAKKGLPVLGVTIGAGQVPAEFKSLEKQLHESGVIRILPPQSHELLNHFIHLSKAVVLLSHVEAQGMAMIEVMGAGGILISGRVGGIKESVIDRETGFLIDPPFDHQELDRLVERVINMPIEERGKIAAQARNRIVNYYSIQASAKKLESLYDELLSANKT